jgi:hypothetical protein
MGSYLLPLKLIVIIITGVSKESSKHKARHPDTLYAQILSFLSINLFKKGIGYFNTAGVFLETPNYIHHS